MSLRCSRFNGWERPTWSMLGVAALQATPQGPFSWMKPDQKEVSLWHPLKQPPPPPHPVLMRVPVSNPPHQFPNRCWFQHFKTFWFWLKRCPSAPDPPMRWVEHLALHSGVFHRVSNTNMHAAPILNSNLIAGKTRTPSMVTLPPKDLQGDPPPPLHLSVHFLEIEIKPSLSLRLLSLHSERGDYFNLTGKRQESDFLNLHTTFLCSSDMQKVSSSSSSLQQLTVH